jgi:hypothetical protein
MRKALVFLLMVSISAPAFATVQKNDRDGRRGARAEKSDDADRAERPERAERPQRAERSERPEPAQQRPAQVERVQRSGGNDGRAVRDERREAVQLQVGERRVNRSGDGRVTAPAVVQRSRSADSVREWRGRERFRENSPTVIQERNRNGREVTRIGGRDSRPVSRVPRQGTQPPISSAVRRLVNHHQWRGDWRGDRRYDWRNHRRRYSSLFNFGFYRDPFGWGYRPFSIGWRMWPNYYQSSYWLNDPWQYRLPYAPSGYRWIRYYDDAILVDTWDGQVVDVIRNFFW